MISGSPIAAAPIAAILASGNVEVLPPDHGEAPITPPSARKIKMLAALRQILDLARSPVSP